MDNNFKKKILQSTSTNRTTAVLKPFSSDFYQRTSIEDGDCEEIKENCGCFHQGKSPNSHNPKKGDKNSMSPTVSAASKAGFPRKKILGERTEAFGSNISETQMEKCPKNGRADAHPQNSPDLHTLSSQITPSPSKDSESGYGSDSTSMYLPYDPLTNYLSPRPQFLRYKPKRRLEKLLQRERKFRSGEEESCSCILLQKSVEEKMLNGDSSQDRTEEQARSNSKLDLKPFHNQEVKETEEGDDDDDDEVDDEEKEERCWHSKLVLKIFLLVGVLFFATFYTSSSNRPAVPPHLQSLQSSKEEYSTIQEPLFQFAENVTLNVDKISETIQQFLNANGGNEINGNLLVLDNHSDSSEEEVVRAMKTDDSAKDLYEDGNREDALFGRTEQEQANEQNSMEVTATIAGDGSKEGVGEQGNAETAEILTVQGGETAEISDPLQASLTQFLVDTFAHENSCSTFEKELREVTQTVSDEGNRRVEISEESENSDKRYEISEQGRETPVFSESLQDSKIQSALESVAPDTRSSSGTELNVSLLGYMKNSFNSRAAIILSLISVLASFTVLVLLRLKGRKASANVSSSPTCQQLPSKLSILENNNLSFPEKGQVLQKGCLSFPEKEQEVAKGDSCANPSSLVIPNNNYYDFHGTHPPAVKLLAEYEYGEISFPEKSSNKKLEVGTDERKCSQSQEIKRSTGKSLPSSTQNPPASEFSTAESPSYGRSFTSQEKLTGKEESSDREEGMNPNAAMRNRKGEILTPVRRSSRIRNRAMSP